MSESLQNWAVAANVISDRLFRPGAKVLWCHGDSDSLCVTGLSRGGRRIQKWLPLKRLRDFRASFIGHVTTGEVLRLASKEQAAEYAARFAELRTYYRPSPRLLGLLPNPDKKMRSMLPVSKRVAP